MEPPDMRFNDLGPSASVQGQLARDVVVPGSPDVVVAAGEQALRCSASIEDDNLFVQPLRTARIVQIQFRVEPSRRLFALAMAVGAFTLKDRYVVKGMLKHVASYRMAGFVVGGGPTLLLSSLAPGR